MIQPEAQGTEPGVLAVKVNTLRSLAMSVKSRHG